MVRGREPQPETIETCGLEECVRQGAAAIGWDQKFGNEQWRNSLHKTLSATHHPSKEEYNAKRKGIGVATVMQGTAIPYLDMGGASIKMNDDGSFQLTGRRHGPGDRF